jgi:uncharacterized protein YqeY
MAEAESLKDRLHGDLTEAIRARDAITSATLRMALTAVKSAEVAGSVARELSDQEVLVVLGKEAKKRQEAATAFAGAGRPAMAEREQAELVVLQGYLPTQLDDDELSALVAEAVAEVAASGATGMAAMGRVMKLVQPKVAGRAEGGRIAAEVKRQLAS